MEKGHISTKGYTEFVEQRQRLEQRGYTYRGLLEQPREEIITIDLYARDGTKVDGKAYFTKDREASQLGARLPSELLKDSKEEFKDTPLQYRFRDQKEEVFLSHSDLELLASLENGGRIRIEHNASKEDALWKLRRDGLLALVREYDTEFHITPQALSGEYLAKK